MISKTVKCSMIDKLGPCGILLHCSSCAVGSADLFLQSSSFSREFLWCFPDVSFEVHWLSFDVISPFATSVVGSQVSLFCFYST